MTILILITILLLILSGIFSATETAYTSISLIQETMLKEENNKLSIRTIKLLKKRGLLITTILIGNNLVNIAASSLVTAMTIKYFGEIYISLSAGILTLLVLIFSEITPKQIALHNNITIARLMSYPMSFLLIVLYPFVIITSGFSKLITKIFNKKNTKLISVQGLRQIVDFAEDQGVVDPNESELLQRVLHFNDTKVKTIMTHRTNVFSLDSNTTVKEAMSLVLEKKFSRIPIYEDNTENVIGILTIKNLLDAIAKNEENNPISKYAIEPIYVLEHKKIDQVFEILQKGKIKCAIVLDEFGGFSGLCSMEDIVEELFGELFDEHENASEIIIKLKKGNFLVDGSISYYQFAEMMDFTTIKEEQSTLASYLIDSIGRIPEQDESIKLSEGSYKIKEKIGNRIYKIIFIKK